MQSGKEAFGQAHGGKAIITDRVRWGLEVTSSITAIVVSYNSAEVLPGCIEGLRNGLPPDQVLVVDNASSDKSVQVARGLGADVIANGVNVGFGAGCNRGAQAAKCDILLFVNPDVRIESVDLRRLNEITTRGPLGLIGPRALLTVDAEHEEPSLRRSLPWPCNVAREALGPILPHEVSGRHLPSPFPSLRTSSRRSWLWGALLLCARAEFLDVGGFDERFFLYYEDQELSRRYARHGLPLRITDAISARHVGGGSSGAPGSPRSISRGASAMSSIELVGIVHGPRTARCAWWLYRGLRRCVSALVWLASRGPLSNRGARKQHELRSTRSAVATLLGDPSSHYLLVKTLARRSHRSTGDLVRPADRAS